MKNIDIATTEKNVRLEWVEPTLQQLEIRDTAVYPTRGLDHPAYQVDCTRS